MITVEYEINGTTYIRDFYDNPVTTKSLLEYVSIDAELPLNWLVNNFDANSYFETLNELERYNILTVKYFEVFWMNVKFNIVYDMNSEYSMMILNVKDTGSIYRQISQISHIDESYLRERFKASNAVDLLQIMDSQLIYINEMRVG